MRARKEKIKRGMLQYVTLILFVYFYDSDVFLIYLILLVVSQ